MSAPGERVVFRWKDGGSIQCQSDRDAFRLFIATRDGSPLRIDRNEQGDYTDPYTQIAWDAWRISNEQRVRDAAPSGSIDRRRAFLDVERAVAEAVEAEREACAKACDKASDDLGILWEGAESDSERRDLHVRRYQAQQDAAAIRARGGAK